MPTTVRADFVVHYERGVLTIADPPEIGAEVALDTDLLRELGSAHGVWVYDDGRLDVLGVTLLPVGFDGGGSWLPLMVVCRRVA